MVCTITWADARIGDTVALADRELRVTAIVRHTGARRAVRLIGVSATGRELHETDCPDAELLLLERP